MRLFISEEEVEEGVLDIDTEEIWNEMSNFDKNELKTFFDEDSYPKIPELNINFLKELAYRMKYVHSDNLQFLIDELTNP